ncbi:MAG: methylenetetrahydrofolate--tRNA-(uracil(54)-C(5))-methyltransferase (FADH(2)-oxidizing) TrmFO [Clostridia bacterium]|nr:methylenetetrahydrofolate--tRNA-(uracil(54)-C(5))-methyltransferase (FADH(2)-oxidizing) TrmFO [Clostridia bacterium]
MTDAVNVIGAGLAGCEAAWQVARRGVMVNLFEMKPLKFSPAHHSEGFAELVCSNSFRSRQLSNAIGLLKEELRTLSSLIMQAADANEVPAGAALAVDRYSFSDFITEKIESEPLINVIRGEVTEIPDGITVIATGPLTSDKFARKISELVGGSCLSFFDAAAPIVDGATIDMSKAYYASRYGKGEAAYINCPMEKNEYEAFYDALTNAQEAALKDFDKESQSGLRVFEGCMPIEVMAKRGRDTLLYGPLKPVGLPDPSTGREPYAVVQLRQENIAKTMFNMVGFQTHLTFTEQKSVFRMIPGLEKADFLRYGVMHRNTYIESPRVLSADYSLKSRPDLFFAGQITGVEGYIESTSSGWLAGVNAALRAKGEKKFVLPPTTAIGALSHYVSNGQISDFQPMNANFGIMQMPVIKIRGGKKTRNEYVSRLSLEYLRNTEIK